MAAGLYALRGVNMAHNEQVQWPQGKIYLTFSPFTTKVDINDIGAKGWWWKQNTRDVTPCRFIAGLPSATLAQH